MTNHCDVISPTICMVLFCSLLTLLLFRTEGCKLGLWGLCLELAEDPPSRQAKLLGFTFLSAVRDVVQFSLAFQLTVVYTRGECASSSAGIMHSARG